MEFRSGRISQIKIYTGKCFRLFGNEKSYRLFISSALIAVIISWVAGEQVFSAFAATRSGAFALICACIWMGIFNSIQSVCRERAIIKREYRTGLYISSYVTAHMIYEFVICLAEALITVVILWVLRGLPTQGVFLPAFLELFITFFLVIYCADLLGMAVSCTVKTENAAMTIMPFALIIQLVMAGLVFPLEGLAKAVSYLTISKWGVEAVCVTANVNALRGADSALRADYLFSVAHLTGIWLLLMGFTLLYAVICVVVLRLVDKDQR